MLADPELTLNPHDPAFLADPYPAYAHYRRRVPVAVVEPYGHPWVFRHRDVVQVLTDQERFGKEPPGPRKPTPGPFGVMSYFPRGLFGSDPPRHTAVRHAVEPILRAEFIRAPEVASELAEQLLKPLRARHHGELMTEFALPLPAGVMFALIGLPATDWDAVGRWVLAIAAAHDISQRRSVRAMGATSSMALKTYVSGLIRRVRAEGGEGFLAASCETSAGDGALTSEDLEMVLMDILVAGYLSTSYLIGTGLQELLHVEAGLGALEDHEQATAAVQELLRLHAPAQIVDRVVLRECTLGGVELALGTTVSAVVGSANRDPEVHSQPDVFRLDRAEPRHLSYGAGIHECIGDALANAVTPVALSALRRASVSIEGLAQWQTDPYLRGMVSLPVRAR